MSVWLFDHFFDTDAQTARSRNGRNENMRWESSVGNALSGSVCRGARCNGPGARRLRAPLVGDGGRDEGLERAGVPGIDVCRGKVIRNDKSFLNIPNIWIRKTCLSRKTFGYVSTEDDSGVYFVEI